VKLLEHCNQIITRDEEENTATTSIEAIGSPTKPEGQTLWATVVMSIANLNLCDNTGSR